LQLCFFVDLEETDEQKDVLATGYVVSTGEHAGGGMGLKLLERRPSPWEELPSSPETFRVISNHEMHDENTPVQQLSHLSDTESSQSVVASSSADTSDMESSDSEMVPECELSTEDMLLLDDVIMDLLSCADTGLYLPPVSADDVDSLLLSPSVVSVAPPAAAYASLKSEPAPITASSLPVYREQVSVESPLTFEMEISLPAATYLPVYEEQVQVPSPASSQSSICTQSSDRKQRKKEQNKTAAQKYRHKKRGEQGLFVTEYQQLERRNIELRTRVEEMTREVDYLKGLIEEICA